VPFYRGVPINVVPASWKQTELQITTDSNAFAAAERDNQRDQHVSEFPAPIVLGVDYIVPGADVWSFDDDEASILGVRAI
jgi:hypothetical protein